LFIIHGLGEHIDRPGYDYLAKKFNEKGLAVFGHDHEGHGRSSGTRSFVESFNDYCSNAVEFIEYIRSRKEYSDKPVYIFGHSMGGLITLKMAIDYPDIFNGVMVSAPPLHDPLPRFTWLLRFIGKQLPKVLSPIGIDLTTLTRNDLAKRAYLEDPLVNKRFYLAWISALDIAREEVLLRSNEIKAPLLIVHSTADQICPIRGTEQLFISFKDKTDKKLIRLEQTFHEFFEDEDRDSIIDMIIEWLDNEMLKVGSLENSHIEDFDH